MSFPIDTTLVGTIQKATLENGRTLYVDVVTDPPANKQIWGRYHARDAGQIVNRLKPGARLTVIGTQMAIFYEINRVVSVEAAPPRPPSAPEEPSDQPESGPS